MISFIIPSFNQGEFIAYAINSVIANMGAKDELIIADGSSTDATDSVVAQFLDDSRISYFSEPDKGFSEAVLKALRRARNPIVGIMSADDAYAQDIRDEVLRCFDESTVDLVYANYETIDLSNKRIGARKHRYGSLEDILSLRILLPQSSVFFRLSSVNLDTILSLDHDYIADVVLFNNICITGRFLFVPKIWSKVRKHPGSRTGKKNPGLQYLNALETTLSSMPKHLRRSAEAGGLLLTARYAASSGDRLFALRNIVRGLVLSPKLLGHWLFPRTFAYLIIGPNGVDQVQRLWRHFSFRSGDQ